MAAAPRLLGDRRWEAQSPVTGIPFLYQSQHYDLGIAHWLALVQAAVRPASVLLVYPSTSAFGLVLLVPTALARDAAAAAPGPRRAGAVALVFAAVPHALYWGHHNGFLQQGYALPLLVFGLVLLARASAPRAVAAGHGGPAGAAVRVPRLGLPAAAPLLGFAAAATLRTGVAAGAAPPAAAAPRAFAGCVAGLRRALRDARLGGRALAAS